LHDHRFLVCNLEFRDGFQSLRRQLLPSAVVFHLAASASANHWLGNRSETATADHLIQGGKMSLLEVNMGEGKLLRRKAKLPFDPNAFLAKVGKGRTLAEYKKKQTIFSQGDLAEAIFYIQKGKVKLTVVSAQGKEAVLALLGRGDFVGEGCLNGHPRRMATGTAMSDCTIMRLEKSSVIHVLQTEPAFSELFLHYLLARNARIEEDLVDHLFNSSEKRLARVLLLLTNFGKEGKSELVPKISQEVLAEMVGTTRSRVSFFMNRFRELGLIEYKSGLKVHSSLFNIVLND